MEDQERRAENNGREERDGAVETKWEDGWRRGKRNRKGEVRRYEGRIVRGDMKRTREERGSGGKRNVREDGKRNKKEDSKRNGRENGKRGRKENAGRETLEAIWEV
jgi:type IV secretory pathway VirB10-like protein